MEPITLPTYCSKNFIPAYFHYAPKTKKAIKRQDEISEIATPAAYATVQTNKPVRENAMPLLVVVTSEKMRKQDFPLRAIDSNILEKTEIVGCTVKTCWKSFTYCQWQLDQQEMFNEILNLVRPSH